MSCIDNPGTSGSSCGHALPKKCSLTQTNIDIIVFGPEPSVTQWVITLLLFMRFIWSPGQLRNRGVIVDQNLSFNLHILPKCLQNSVFLFA